MPPKKVLKKITIDEKKEIIEKHERGVRVSDLSAQYKMAKSTISTILKNKEAIKAANVCKGVTCLSKQRTQVIEEVEKLLLVWLNEKQLAGDSVSEGLICEKARHLHDDLSKTIPGTSEAQEFKASRGWFEKFKKRTGLHNVIRHGEAASSDFAAAEAYKATFASFIEEEGYVPHQVFNCDETGLFWKKMPRRTFITQEETKLPGHKPMKDRLTLLLCSNASGDFKVKPLLVYHSENPRVFKKNNVVKTRLPVLWKSNSKAWVTRNIFKEWLHEVFAPSVKAYLQENGLPVRCLLLMDNAPAHPPSLVDNMDEDMAFIQVKFLPPNTTPLIQPMDQQVIANFKRLYTKALFSRCFQVTNDTDLTLRDFWKNHFNIFHCINLIDKAWNDVTYRTLKASWRKLWPACVPERDFEGFGEETGAPEVEEIVSIGKTLGLEVNEEDVEELLDDHKEDLNTTELQELQNEQQKTLTEEHSSHSEDEEREEVVPSEVIREVLAKWNDVQEFIEKHHSNKTVAIRTVNLMNDNVMSQFRKVLQNRRRQITLDRFLLKSAQQEEKAEEPAAKRARRELTPEVELPAVLMEGDSPSKQ